MPRMCEVTGKKTQVGMNVSHSHRRTKRTFLPNLQTMKFHSDILARDFSLRISMAGLRTLTKHGGLDSYLINKPISRLTEDMAKIKRLIAKKITLKKPEVKNTLHKPVRSARLIKKVESKKQSA